MTTHDATLIGGHGFIGARLHARLQRDGWSCWLPRRDDPELWLRPLGHVFHCAGLTADYAERPFDTVEAHASLLNRLLRDARFDSLVYLSSTRLYDSLGAVDATEDLPLCLSPDNPRHLYDLSKALGESLCRVAGGGRARVARLSCVWSDTADANGFLPDLLRQVLAGRDPGSAGDAARHLVATSPALARDYVHVDDVVEGLLHLATHRGFGIYNVAEGQNIDNGRLLAHLGKAGDCELVATGASEGHATPRISITRMRDAFGWRPTGVLERTADLIGRRLACSPS